MPKSSDSRTPVETLPPHSLTGGAARVAVATGLLLVCSWASGCSSGADASGASGGSTGSGGATGTFASGGAGAVTTGGVSGTGGGSTGASSGGASQGGTATGGAGIATGGAGTATGGTSSGTGTGGSSGGATATGGRAGGSGSGGNNTGGISGKPGSGGASAGTGGAAGQTGSGGAVAACGSLAGTATRPQLTSAEASNFTKLKYLAQSDSWNPTAGLGQASAFTANFTVAADGSGTHTTVQAALNAAASGSARRYILIKPGTYRGSVTLSGATPITIYGADSDATKVVIVDGKSATSAGGTGKSATFTSTADGLQLMNLTVSNDFATPPTGTNIQAVALYTTGDKNILQNVRLHGFQDTLFTDTASESRASRVYIKDSYIEGDTDFIFGGATLVIDGGTINYLSSRKASGGGACLAPSTRTSSPYGFLVVGASFTAAATALPNKVSLGRSWDEGGITPTPNGQAVVRESMLGPHIRKLDPWAAAATSARPFSATGNRFSEYCNSGPGSAP